MPMIYQIGAGGYWTGASREIGERDGAPRGWTRAAVPELGVGEYAVWAGGGWRVTDQPYTRPAPTMDEAKAARLAELAAYRWQIETGGIVRNSAAIATDDRSQAKISGALQLVQDDPQVVIDWKADSGWVQLDAAAVTYIAREIGLHVQACFSREKELAAEIDACTTVQEVAAVDITTGWPEQIEA